MAENDIYDNKRRYENFKCNIEQFCLKPSERSIRGNQKSKYYIKNSNNVQYFRKLFLHFDSRDLSFVRRMRASQALMLICFATDKNLVDCVRDDINGIVAYMHSVYSTPNSKADFIKDLKYLWRTLFPETDIKGRVDETLTPYVVRHLSGKIDKSKEKMRNDRLSWNDFENLLNYFCTDIRFQAYLFLALESLGRPQELLYLKLRDLEFHDNYAKIYISEHGKEGTGFLQCIDSYPYISKLYNQHPLKHDKNAFLFYNGGVKNKFKQLKPCNLNKVLRTACKNLNIDKDITCYSLKRNGVTFRRLRGDSDVEIQHAARWTSTKQLKIYDMSNQEDAFKMELIKRGIINSNDKNDVKQTVKRCVFCSKLNGLTNEVCENCNRPLDREKIKLQEKNKDDEISQLKNELETIKSKVYSTNTEFNSGLFEVKQIQDLFRVVYKLQEEINRMK